MQLNTALTPPLPKPQAPLTPATQMALSPVVQAAQQTAPTIRTQTVQATQAVGKADQPRDVRSGVESGQAVDTRASALNARTNGRGYANGTRGSLLDVSV
ncbi:hypothetical protein [Azospirillum sp. SYSU D00513]|uniref:hypothetical protein n=1 Tax=Azospirillum sp. SYSU D00513 TaxID=2812561 RepID=UPI001FFF3A51|nr:hypothetical protein [Azospirillum sp. SYSU D00513]